MEIDKCHKKIKEIQEQKVKQTEKTNKIIREMPELEQ